MRWSHSDVAIVILVAAYLPPKLDLLGSKGGQ